MASKRKEAGTDEEKNKKIAPLTSLAEIDAQCRTRQAVEFIFRDKPCRLELAPLMPAQEAKIAEIVDVVIPPVVKGKSPDEDRLDTTNADYVKKRTEAGIKARAVAIYWAFPAFSIEKPNLTDFGEIRDFVQSKFTESILFTLRNATLENNIQIAELVNFT